MIEERLNELVCLLARQAAREFMDKTRRTSTRPTTDAAAPWIRSSSCDDEVIDLAKASGTRKSQKEPG